MFKIIKKNVGYIWRFNRNYLIVVVIGMILPVLNTLSCSYFPKVLIDSLQGEDFDRTWKVILFFCLLQLVIAVVLHVVSYWKMSGEERLNIKLTSMLAKTAVASDYEKYEDYRFREKIGYANQCVKEKCMEQTIEKIMLVFSDVVTIISLLYIVSFVGWWLWLFAAVSVAVTGICEYIRTNYNFNVYRDRYQIDQRMLYARDRLTWRDYAKETRLFHMYDYVTYIANFYMDLLSDIQKEQAKKTFSLYIILALLEAIQRGLVFSIVAWQLYTQTISIADFSMATVAIMNLFLRNNDIVRNLIQIYDISRYVKTFLEVVQEKPEAAAAQILLKERFEIRFEHVSFSYPGEKTEAVKDISHSFCSGKIYGIVGENGGGKTTFVNLLMGLYHPAQGKILLDGRDSAEFASGAWFELFSPVFQDYNMYAYRVLENVGMFHADALSVQKKMEEYDLAWLKPDAYITSAYEQGVEISGGEAQKIALLRAINKDAPVFVMDEPTSALSASAEFDLYARLREEFKGKTVFLISHRLASCRLCDEILVFQEGRVIESGTHEALMEACGVYAEMFCAQAKLYQENEMG